MSTVADVISLMQYRVDHNADLIHLVNQAIRLVAKRLYLTNSGLLRQPLSLSLPGSVTYTAATIAFDATVSPNRITDSGNGLLTGGLTGGHSFTTDDSLNP